MKTKYSQNINISPETKLGENVIIHSNVSISGNSIIEDNVEIFSNTEITNSIIGQGSNIKSSVIENSIIGNDNSIGPFSHIRPNTKTGSNVKIGNFVEVKSSEIGNNTKICHLTYVGDAIIGKNCNIGCGVIFANYNGKIKQQSIVGNNVFIGSNTNIIAPVKIEDKAYICAGTTITKDIPSSSFVIGRVREEIKLNRNNPYNQ